MEKYKKYYNKPIFIVLAGKVGLHIFHKHEIPTDYGNINQIPADVDYFIAFDETHPEISIKLNTGVEISPTTCIPLTSGSTILGRSNECDIVISEKLISRKHVNVVLENNIIKIIDLDTLNGTAVREESVSEFKLVNMRPKFIKYNYAGKELLKKDNKAETENIGVPKQYIDRIKYLFIKAAKAEALYGKDDSRTHHLFTLAEGTLKATLDRTVSYPEESVARLLTTYLRGLGKAEEESMLIKSKDIDYDQLLAKTNVKAPIFLLRDGELINNPEFNDFTTTEKILNVYLSVIKAVLEVNPSIKKQLFEAVNMNKFINIHTLSEFKLFAARNFFGDESVDLIRVVVDQFNRVKKQIPASQKEEHLIILQLINPEARQLQLQDEPSRIAIKKDFDDISKDNSDIMIVHQGYNAKDWRPADNVNMFPGEKVLHTEWRGKTFFLYTSRSHTLKGSIVHQWRSTDMYVAGKWFKKSNPENLDDCSPKFCIMLDQVLYKFESKRRLRNLEAVDASTINESLAVIN